MHDVVHELNNRTKFELHLIRNYKQILLSVSTVSCHCDLETRSRTLKVVWIGIFTAIVHSLTLTIFIVSRFMPTINTHQGQATQPVAATASRLQQIWGSDAYHLLSRSEQVAIFRLWMSHNRLKHHLCTKFGIGQLDLCPCQTCSITAEHLLQACPLHGNPKC